mmetsp:Transcript_25601/g.50108  ORF Transcript_25601/g.50108 Transcript_25601/m.50108 type:complete len:196 (+) Transcript_25601:1519-2106(+)
MLGEILLWNPLASQPVKRILRTTLGALVGTMSVVERWFLQDVRGFPSQQRQKLSKKEAMGEADIRTEGEVRIFACLQDLDNGAWNLIDLTVETASDGSFRKTSVPMRRYPCEKSNIREAPDWVVSGGVAVIAGRTETKVWTLGSENFHAINHWAPKKKIDELVPNVSRVALSPNTAYMCTSKAASLNVYRMTEAG